MFLYYPAERALTSDWFVNTFIMVVYENISLVALLTENSD